MAEEGEDNSNNPRQNRLHSCRFRIALIDNAQRDMTYTTRSARQDRFKGTIEALSPIHIGSGIIDLGQDVELIKTAVRTSGNVVIPGSSLKGAIRSVVEAISESCVCKVSGRIRRAVPRDFAECRQKERLCVACRIFGAMGFHGNVAIQDAPQIEGEIVTKLVPELYAPGRYQHVKCKTYRDASFTCTGK